jgi:hypothetical protein
MSKIWIINSLKESIIFKNQLQCILFWICFSLSNLASKAFQKKVIMAVHLVYVQTYKKSKGSVTQITKVTCINKVAGFILRIMFATMRWIVQIFLPWSEAIGITLLSYEYQSENTEKLGDKFCYSGIRNMRYTSNVRMWKKHDSE